MDWFQIETRSSTPYPIGDRLLTVHSRVIQILTPVGGFIWNYPVAVTVRSAFATDEGLAVSEGEERYPIIDPTRMAQIGLFGLAMLAVILFWRKRS